MRPVCVVKTPTIYQVRVIGAVDVGKGGGPKSPYATDLVHGSCNSFSYRRDTDYVKNW